MPTRRPVLLALVLATAALAGCVDALRPPAETARDAPAPAATDADVPPPAPPQNSTGTLVVRTLMPDLSILPGVNVTLPALGASRTSDRNGLARFDNVTAGRISVEARKEAHRTAQLAVEVGPGETVQVDAVLPPDRGDQHAHEQGVHAHRDTYRFEGHFDCSATYVIITGDCLLVVDYVANATGVPARPGDATSERHIIDFPLDRDWATLVVEMAWEPPQPGMGEGMTLALEPAEAPADGHAAKYARTFGGSPLRVELLPGVKHETATAEDMPNPLGGEVIRARAFVMGAAHRPGGTDFLGVGVSKDHAFTLVVSIFYEEPAPAGYSAL